MTAANTLVINAGSSSLRVVLFDPDLTPLFEAHAERLETESAMLHCGEKAATNIPMLDAVSAMELVNENILKLRLEVDAILYRFVHGGTLYSAPVPLTSTVRDDLSEIIHLAPNHLRASLAVAEAMAYRYPYQEHVAMFDTAAFTDLPSVATEVPLPRDFQARCGFRRFGFHGFSHLSSMLAMRQKGGGNRVLTCHLGNGCSATIWDQDQALETSMGYSPAEGLMMGNRSGSLDPNLVIDLIHELNGDLHRAREILNNESGMTGICGLSDMRDILTAIEMQDESAVDALNLFVHRAALLLGGFITLAGGVDALVFSGGIGEHCAEIRYRICQHFKWMGMSLDEEANRKGEETLHASDSSITIHVLPADEEQTMARMFLKEMDV